MFRQLTENPNKPAGKLANETTLHNIKTHYSLGRPEWEDPWQSNTKATFLPQEVKYERAQKRAGNQICFGTDSVNYLSNTKAAFDGMMPDNYQRAKPFRDKATLQATNFTLGEDIVHYRTAAQQQFAHPQQQPFKEQPKFKNYNQRIDVITAQLYDQNKRSYGFEGFSEDPQHKKSQNQTSLPQDLYVTDPITGRRIIRRGQ